jgi:hypothetical protein
VDIMNPHLHRIFDTAQREELVELVRHAPETPVSSWLAQELPERGGGAHIPHHKPDFLLAVVAVEAATINSLRERIEALEEAQGE